MRILALVATLASALAAVGQDPKSPVPDASAQKEAEKLIRDIFKDEFAKKAGADRVALSKKLLDQASQTKDDVASRYVLLRKAKDLASQAGDLDLALKAVDQIAAGFEGETASMRSAVLAAVAKAAKTPEEFQKLARSFLALSDEASGVDLYDVADKAADQASALARRAKDVPLTTKADARGRQVADRKSRFEKTKKARETLAANPAEPAANLTVGFYEVVRGNWETGLPLLAKGSDPVLKGLAEKELAPPAGAPEEISLADGWWDLSEKEKDPVVKEGLLKRARFWYRRAFPNVTGLSKAKVEKRMGDALADQFGGTWIDITDPKGFGQPGRPGDAIALTPKADTFLKVILDKMPAGDFDGLMVRVRHKVERKGIGMLLYEGDTVAGYFDVGGGKYFVMNTSSDGKSWVSEMETPSDPRNEYTITVINAEGEYIHYLDGKEMGRQKVRVSRIMRVGLWVEHEVMIFDQIRLRRKE